MDQPQADRAPLAFERAIVPAKLAHFVLRTARFDVVIDWYRTVLGAEIVFRNDRLCFLTYDDEHHRLAVINQPGAAEPSREQAGVDHIAFAFRDLGELLATYGRLKAAGILPVRTINHGPTTSFYYRDPDGLRIELQVDNFATVAELKGYFQGADFAQNPIGVLVDPEQLIRDYAAGVPLAELARRPALPPGSSPWDMRRERQP
jgi:catechol 2,3-dioxygenase-like lactoylglutathione lyase family enzyme